jgi:hypothetical protein
MHTSMLVHLIRCIWLHVNHMKILKATQFNFWGCKKKIFLGPFGYFLHPLSMKVVTQNVCHMCMK